MASSKGAFGDAVRTAMADAAAVLYNSGYLRIYSGTQPATPATAITSQVLLAELRYGATAFAAAVAGVATANAITSDSAADNTGIANFARSLKSDGTTVLEDENVSNQTVTLGAGAALNAVSLTVVALTKPLYAGQDLWFVDATDGTLKKASVTVNAATGATSVTTSALAAAIANGSATVAGVTMNSVSLVEAAAVAASSKTLTAQQAAA